MFLHAECHKYSNFDHFLDDQFYFPGQIIVCQTSSVPSSHNSFTLQLFLLSTRLLPFSWYDIWQVCQVYYDLFPIKISVTVQFPQFPSVPVIRCWHCWTERSPPCRPHLLPVLPACPSSDPGLGVLLQSSSPGQVLLTPSRQATSLTAQLLGHSPGPQI